MALIKCPECGKEISNKATSCPNCGCPIASDGNVHSADVVSAVPQTSGNHKTFIVIAIIAAVLVGVAVLFFFQQHKAAARAQYIDTLNEVTLSMLDGAARSEGVCNLTKSVWYNTIYEKSDPETDPYTKISSTQYFHDDFNTSLSALYADENMISDIAYIKENQETVTALMSQLSQPTDEFSQCYSTLTEMYNAYDKFTNLAVSPTGSFQTYSSDFKEYDSDFMSSYNLIQTLIPEK